MEQSDYREDNVSDFKSQHPLLDDGGNPVGSEPDEADLFFVHLIAGLIKQVTRFFRSLNTLMLVLYMLFRFYLFSCWTQWNVFTQAKLNGKTFPLSMHMFEKVKDDCEAKVKGTGLPPGSGPCRPSVDQVLDLCKDKTLEGGPPEAGRALLFQLTGKDIPGVPCEDFEWLPIFFKMNGTSFVDDPYQLCGFRQRMVQLYDPPILASTPFLGQVGCGFLAMNFLLIYTLKLVSMKALRHWATMNKKAKQKAMSKALKGVKAAGGGSAWKPSTASQQKESAPMMTDDPNQTALPKK